MSRTKCSRALKKINNKDGGSASHLEDAIAAVNAIASIGGWMATRRNNVLAFRPRPRTAAHPAICRPALNPDRLVAWLNSPWPGKPLPSRPIYCFIRAEHPEPEPVAIPVTFFPDRAAKTKDEKRLTLAELADLIRATSAPTKEALPWLKLARFGKTANPKTRSGSLRWNDNVLGITGIVVDYDGEKLGVDEAVERLDKAGVSAIVYTSPSHTDATPRWRVICPCSKELPPEQHYKLVSRVNGALGGILADESFTLSQSYYYGAVNGSPPPLVEIVNGVQCLDQCDELDEIGKPNGRGNGRAHAPGKPQAPIADIIAALEVIPNDDLSWDEWNRLGMATWRASGGSKEGFEAFDSFSRKSKKYDAEETRYRWNHFHYSPPDKIGYGTLVHEAQQVEPDWEPPSRQPNGQGLPGVGGIAPASPVDKEEEEEDAAFAAEIARLSRLKQHRYALQRKDAAKRLKLPVGMLDRLVKAAYSENSAGLGQGQPVEIPEIEPWPEAVDGIELLNGLAKAIRKYVVVSHQRADAMALWVARTHAHPAFDTNPILWITSVEMRSGKSHTCDVLRRVVARPVYASSVTAAALLRLAETHHPTVILDEFDALIKRNPEMAETLRGMLNSCFNRATAHHIMTIPKPSGGHEPRQFDTYTPIVLSGIGEAPGTVRDRALRIEMQRKLKNEKIERLGHRDGADLHELARKAARWAQDYMEELRNARPVMPEWLNDRAADAWEPLFTIAELAGGEWRERAEAATLALSGAEAAEVSTGHSVRIMLLADIRNLFIETGTDRLSSHAIVRYLARLEGRPWPEYGKGRQPISKGQVARLLAPFRILPGTIRMNTQDGDEEPSTVKGYKLSTFQDAFDRYLSPLPPKSDFQAVTPTHVEGFCGAEGDFETSHGQGVTFTKNPENPSAGAACDVVTAKNAHTLGACGSSGSVTSPTTRPPYDLQLKWTKKDLAELLTRKHPPLTLDDIP
jgi:hypothetical protein